MTENVRLGLTGIHGFAHHLSDRLFAAWDKGSSLQLTAVTAPEVASYPEHVTALQARGVQIIDSYEAMLARSDLDAVWLPLPIDLHVPFAERALHAGKAVMVEKPVAATVQDCDRLIAVKHATGLPVAVGFTTIYDPATLALKRRLLAGELGAIHRLTVLGCWPRDSIYYNRADWVGRIRRNGHWVLDSPANNALSHYVNLAFFLLGENEQDSAEPTRVQAELYRANPIENYDTCSLRYETGRADATHVHFMFTHACAEREPTVITIEGERGQAVWTTGVGASIEIAGQKATTIPASDDKFYIMKQFAHLVRGVPDPDMAISTLETARIQTLAVNGASQAAAVHDIPADRFEVRTKDNGATLRVVPRIADVFQRALAEDKMLHESGLVDWSVPPGDLDLHGYDHFTDVPRHPTPAPDR